MYYIQRPIKAKPFVHSGEQLKVKRKSFNLSLVTRPIMVTYNVTAGLVTYVEHQRIL